MECSCYDTGDGCDPVTLLSDKYPKARKEHTCKECWKTIHPKSKYRLEKYIFEGKIETHKTCLDCDSIREHLVCGSAYGNLWEGLFDSMEYYGDESYQWSMIGKLTPIARNKVLEYIENEWERWEDDE